MPADLVKGIDLDALYPPFLEKLLALLSKCRADGHTYYALSGYRDVQEQARLYFQGRTLPGKRVTNAKPGFSLHNYGVAADVAFDTKTKAGLQPSFLERDFDPLKVAAREFNLQVGIRGLADYGHVQLPFEGHLGRSELGTLIELKFAHDEKGIAGAWKKLDEWGPW